MEIRVLRYFLETAREGNMTRAAQRLHISQPTMSKQLKELEEELGAKLFTRSNYSIHLTEAGMLLRERAEDIVSLADKTLEEFRTLDEIGKGGFYIGAAESDAVRYFTETVHRLQQKHPGIRCNIYSGNMEDVCEKLDKGVLDFAIIMSYVDLAKYNYLPLPASDTWGVIMRRDDPLSDRSSLSVRDLIGLPLLCSRQWLDQDFPQWFGLETEDANIVATWNLTYNASVMVKTGMGYAITYDKLADTSENSELAFVPLRGVPQSDIFIIWRKNQAFSPAARLLLDTLRQTFRPDPDEI